MNKEVISTNHPVLDEVLGIGGLPKGKIVEIYGSKGTGKTTLAIEVAINAQKLGTVCYIDTEHSFRPSYAKQRGLDIKRLIVIQPKYEEEIFKIAEKLLKTNEVSLIIIDSISGLESKTISNALSNFVEVVQESNACALFLNQIREKIGTGQVASGTKDLRFYACVRINLHKIKSLKRGVKFIGSLIKATILKNKLAPPFREVVFKLMFNKEDK